jgi:hypothetical protein
MTAAAWRFAYLGRDGDEPIRRSHRILCVRSRDISVTPPDRRSATSDTPGPTASTVPAPSWPSVCGSSLCRAQCAGRLSMKLDARSLDPDQCLPLAGSGDGDVLVLQNFRTPRR